ncbi:SDR family NAD(P)-dependent oxidoreductase [Nocardioides stalactiti]|uniref:SDR family NAD(P)-dependent oxidoreductase n=1 Tax=Nocardioides stalactiti TaxID=2755356 RepID=UPI0016033CC0|nr:SDR family NAD(P)-dependent oxidoreductase [Nocardioides stalactiti]
MSHPTKFSSSASLPQTTSRGPRKDSRRVLVTGGASGLGAALVAEFAARGDRVLVADRVEPTTPADGVQWLRLDVTSDDDWAAALEWVTQEWGGLDVLVNNAGIASGGRIDVATIAEWQRVIDVNLLGVVRGCRTFTPGFKAQGSGHIVNTASLAGLVHPPGMSSYTAVKAGVVALSETLSYELDPYGVLVTAVCPGFFRTNLASSIDGSDAAVGHLAARLIEKSTYSPDQIAAEVMKGIDEGAMVVVPDEPARLAVWAKAQERPTYDQEQRSFAARIKTMAEQAEGNA